MSGWSLHATDIYVLDSLNDRRPVSSEDEVVVLVVPDYQMIAEVQKIASFLSEDTENEVIFLLRIGFTSVVLFINSPSWL